MSTQFTPLTREQKLMAEQIVQLGNIVEAIRAAAMGEDSSSLMQEIAELKTELQNLQTQRAMLTSQLAASTTQVAELQSMLNQVTDGDITPDSVSEVISHLGIEVGE